MSPANKNALVLMAGSILMIVGVFAKPLHIPDQWDFVPMFLAVVCFYFFFRADKKIKMAREKLGQPVPIAPLAARKKRFWLIAFLLIAGSIGFMPLLPYTVENFKSWLYFYVVPFEVVTVSLILFFIWKKLVGPSDSSK